MNGTVLGAIDTSIAADRAAMTKRIYDFLTLEIGRFMHAAEYWSDKDPNKTHQFILMADAYNNVRSTFRQGAPEPFGWIKRYMEFHANDPVGRYPPKPDIAVHRALGKF